MAWLRSCHFLLHQLLDGDNAHKVIRNIDFPAALTEAEQAAEAEIEEYKQLSDWASLYKQCSFEAKKMIVSRLVKSVHVYREYHIDIEFNVSFEEFRQLEIDGKSLPADPTQGIEKQA